MQFHYTWQFGRIVAPLLGFLHRSGFFDPAVYLSVMTIPALALFAWVFRRASTEISGSTSKPLRGLRYFLYFFMCWMAMSSLAAGFKTMIVEELAYQERKWFEPYLPAAHFYIASAFLVDLALVGEPVLGPFRLLAAGYLQVALLAGYGAAIYRVFHEDVEGVIAGVILFAFFLYRNYALAVRLLRRPSVTRHGADAGFLPAIPMNRSPRLFLYALTALAVVLSLFLAGDRQSERASSIAASSDGAGTLTADVRPSQYEPEMVRIPAGEFLMGSDGLGSAERPVHRVSLDEYYIGKFEVTNAQYKIFCDATGRPYPQARWSHHSHHSTGSDLTAKPMYPVVDIGWDDALAYSTWLSQTTGRKYRLPTEAEWEKAARGGLEGKKYPWGDESYDANGHYRANAGSEAENKSVREKDGFLHTAPVGSFPPNGYGLYDMAGNVWEWCVDFYDATYYARSTYKNPQGPDKGDKRVIRGGSWFGGPERMESAARLWNYASIRYASTGLRVAMTP